MSLPAFESQGTLFGSVGVVAGGLFEEGERYRLFAQKIWPVLAGCRPQLEQCYCANNGRAGIEPVVLLGVLIFQFFERVPDRVAAELVKYHLGWKLALHLELDAKGFHATTLVTFRQRLVEHGQAKLAFTAVLDALQSEGLVPKKGKQRLDSTHVLGVVSRMSRLECLRETLRLALQELAPKLAESERPDCWGLLWERYVENKLDFKSSEAVLRDKMRQAGADSQALLTWLKEKPAPVREGRSATLLQRVFEEQFETVCEGSPEPFKAQCSTAVKNPHEPEAQWSAKGLGAARKEWIGYKVQVAESIGSVPASENQPQQNFLTSIVTQDAIESDAAGLAVVLEEQCEAGLEPPRELYVDTAYVSAEELAHAAAEGREVIGPARASTTTAKGFRSEEFEVRIAERKAICPAGKESTQCSRIEEKSSGKSSYRFEWSRHCHGCPLRDKCVGKGQRHRTLSLGEHHDQLQHRRREQNTPEFRKRMHQRNAIEGTQSELVRAHGMRRARYRGKAKVDLQNQLIGAACNIKRWLRVLAAKAQCSTAATAQPTPAIAAA